MSEDKILWSSVGGDLRKKKNQNQTQNQIVDEKSLEILIRRLKSGKGREVLELTGLPSNSDWCKKFAKDLKKSLGVGGSFKNDFIEIHTANFEALTLLLAKKNLKWKKIGG